MLLGAGALITDLAARRLGRNCIEKSQGCIYPCKKVLKPKKVMVSNKFICDIKKKSKGRPIFYVKAAAGAGGVIRIYASVESEPKEIFSAPKGRNIGSHNSLLFVGCF